ncbi:MAG: hypothetical protein AAGK32_21065, partial [Actinomycetota bacterium]
MHQGALVERTRPGLPGHLRNGRIEALRDGRVVERASQETLGPRLEDDVLRVLCGVQLTMTLGVRRVGGPVEPLPADSAGHPAGQHADDARGAPSVDGRALEERAPVTGLAGPGVVVAGAEPVGDGEVGEVGVGHHGVDRSGQELLRRVGGGQRSLTLDPTVPLGVVGIAGPPGPPPSPGLART